MAEALLACAVIATGAAVAFIRARSIAQRRPDSPAGIVLRAIDDQILWSGIVFGSVVMGSWRVARATVPWLAWSWVDTSIGSVATGAADSGSGVVVAVLAIAILAMYAAVPAAAVVSLAPPLALMLTVWGAERALLDQRRHPVRAAVIGTVALLLLGVPPVIAVECPLLTLAAAAMITRRSSHRVAVGRQASTKMDQGSRAGTALSSLWDPLPRGEQDRCAKVSAFIVVLAAAMSVTYILEFLLLI